MTEETLALSLYEGADIDTAVKAADKLTQALDRYQRIESEDDVRRATEILAQAKGFLKQVEEQRTEFVRPYIDRKKVIDDEAKAIKAPLERVISHFDNIIKVWMRKEQDRLKAEEAKRIEDQRAANQPKIEELHRQLTKLKADLSRVKKDEIDEVVRISGAIGEIVDQIRALGGTAEGLTAGPVRVRATGSLGSKHTLIEHWKADLEDINQVPREYLTVDWPKVNAAVKAGAREIAGFKIHDEGSLRSRSAS